MGEGYTPSLTCLCTYSASSRYTWMVQCTQSCGLQRAKRKIPARYWVPYQHFSIKYYSIPVSEGEQSVRNNVLIDSGIKGGSDRGCQAACARVAPVEVCVIFSLPIARLNAREAPRSPNTYLEQ